MKDLSKALGYCRVSTQRQVSEGHGLERYIKQLKDYGLNDEQIHWDIESGASEKRRGYNRVLDLVRSGKVDKLIVPCFDRFTRSALGWEVAKDELKQYGVELIFLDGGTLDLDTPEGIFTSRILAAMSAQVRDKNKYNSSLGARSFREQRKVYQAIFGFVKDGDSLKPNTELYRDTNKTYQQVAVEAIEIFLESGELTGTIRKLINKYGLEKVGTRKHHDFPRDVSSFRRWLENPLLCGMICYFPFVPEKKIVVQSEHEGIITVEQYNQIMYLLSQHPKIRRRVPNNPLSRIARCGVCGSSMDKYSSVYNSVRYEYLRCSGCYNKPRKPHVCESRVYYPLDKAVEFCIKELKIRAKSIGETYTPEANDIKIPGEILELQQQILKLKQLNDPDLKSAIITKEQRLESLIRTSEVEAVADVTRNEILKEIAGDNNFWEHATREDLIVLFHELIDELVCSVVDSNILFSARFKI